MSRLFLAVPAAVENFEALQGRFDPFVRGRWVSGEQRHLTLLFFGNRFEAGELIEHLEQESLGFAPSELRGLGYFKRNRILFARTENPSLERLYRRLCKRLDLSCRPLLPHVTLMRIKALTDPAGFKEALREYDEVPLGRLEPKLRLYKSELRPEGARYTVLKEWR